MWVQVETVSKFSHFEPWLEVARRVTVEESFCKGSINQMISYVVELANLVRHSKGYAG